MLSLSSANRAPKACKGDTQQFPASSPESAGAGENSDDEVPVN